MLSETTESSKMVGLLAWIEVNKKKLAIGGAVAILAIIVASIVIQQRAQREQNASAALSEVRLPFNPGAPLPSGLADALNKVAVDYKGTKAATRALLISAAVLYQEGNYVESQARFQQILQQYPDSAWNAEANLGVAVALAAQGKTAEATAKYEEIRRRFANAPIIDVVKLALVRLYATQKPEEAFKLTDELLKSGGQNSGLAMEAGMLQEDLLKKHPELAKLREPLVQPTPQLSLTNQPIRVTSTNRPMVVTSMVSRAATNLKMIGVTNLPGTNAPIPIKLSPLPPQSSSSPAPTQPPPASAPPPGK
jgi:predicted negative regulator of RcsB-dependent stress response